jgi:DNA-binding CsgD family transcriptional regulator
MTAVAAAGATVVRAKEQKSGQMRNAKNPPTQPGRMPEVGMVILDESFNLIACDRGAAALLSTVKPGSEDSAPVFQVPREILEGIRQHKNSGATTCELQFHVGSTVYLCRSYLLETRSGHLTELSFMALHLERIAGAQEAIQDAIAMYNLTEREEQTLKGILMGLSTKEVADQMSISPNTVKAFTRLIMIKLGVTTRWGIIAKVLGSREASDDGSQSAAGSGMG